jgi:hypothetical protein
MKLKLSIPTKTAIAATVSAIGYCAYADLPLLAGLIIFFPAWMLMILFSWMLNQ